MCASGDAAAAAQPLGFWELLEYIVMEAPPALSRDDGQFSPELCDFVSKCLVKVRGRDGTGVRGVRAWGLVAMAMAIVYACVGGMGGLHMCSGVCLCLKFIYAVVCVQDAKQRPTIEVLSRHAFLQMHKGTKLSDMISWAMGEQ